MSAADSLPAGALPSRSYRIAFLPLKRTVEVDPAELPYAREGLLGSLLDIAVGHGIEIDHACGGVCACATCHVLIREGASACGEPTEEEEDQLDNAPGFELGASRLACQTVPDGSCDLVVEIPDWNRNMVSEEH